MNGHALRDQNIFVTYIFLATYVATYVLLPLNNKQTRPPFAYLDRMIAK